MHETIADYYYPDQDQSSMQRPASVLERHSASFWAEFNNAAEKHGLNTVDVNSQGLPEDVGKAYKTMEPTLFLTNPNLSAHRIISNASSNSVMGR